MSDTDRSLWNERYSSASTQPIAAAHVLSTYAWLLPSPETANGGAVKRSLDLAAGLGGNALFLAQLGFESFAWDISEVAMDKLEGTAREQHLKIHTEARDVVLDLPPENYFDVIVVSRFLDRRLTPALIEALRPGGLIYYQTFVTGNSNGPSNPDYLLLPNELLRMFASLTIRIFEDAGRNGDTSCGLRNESMIVAEKPGENV